MSKHARFIGIDTVTYEKGKVYPVIGYEHGLFRVDNLDGEDYVLPPKVLNLFILHDLQERGCNSKAGFTVCRLITAHFSCYKRKKMSGDSIGILQTFLFGHYKNNLGDNFQKKPVFPRQFSLPIRLFALCLSQNR